MIRQLRRLLVVAPAALLAWLALGGRSFAEVPHPTATPAAPAVHAPQLAAHPVAEAAHPAETIHSAAHSAPAVRTIRLEPALPKGTGTGVAMQKVTTPLFGKQIRLNDPVQGALGDCYLVATLSAIAQRSPELIRNAVTELPDGTVRVRFYHRRDLAGGKARYEARRSGTSFEPVDVIVDTRVPSTRGKPVYTTGGASSWPSIVEKAYAAFQEGDNGYGDIDGGFAGSVLEALTGQPAKWMILNVPNTDRVVAQISEAVKAGKPVLAATRLDARFAATMAKVSPKTAAAFEAKKRLTAAARPDGPEPLAKYGLASDHEFTVLGVGKKDGKTMIVLRNPWGVYEPAPGGIGSGPTSGYDRHDSNGVFALPAEEFGLLFAYAATIDPKGALH